MQMRCKLNCKVVSGKRMYCKRRMDKSKVVFEYKFVKEIHCLHSVCGVLISCLGNQIVDQYGAVILL